jgi:hypothetical protein
MRRVADELGPWVPRHHPVRLKVHLRFGPRAGGCSVWVSLRAPYARTARSHPGWASRRPIYICLENLDICHINYQNSRGVFHNFAHFQKGRKFRVLTIFRGSGAHTGRDLAVVMAGAARRWVGVMEGPTGAPSEVDFRAFLALKNRNFRPFGLRNGSAIGLLTRYARTF